MLLLLIVAGSLVFQAVSAYFAVRLIAVTRWKTAWLLLSAGIISMALRRAMNLQTILDGSPTTAARAMEFEVIGLIGSALMLSGIILIKPIFVSLTAAEREQRQLAAKLQDALSNIKVLSGLLPICSHCKRVRDDRGYWGQLEVYIRNHSNADFSHSICPECARTHFGDFYPNAAASADAAEKK